MGIHNTQDWFELAYRNYRNIILAIGLIHQFKTFCKVINTTRRPNEFSYENKF